MGDINARMTSANNEEGLETCIKSWFEILDKLGIFVGSDGSAVDQLDQ
jgi:hypothetical protein